MKCFKSMKLIINARSVKTVTTFIRINVSLFIVFKIYSSICDFGKTHLSPNMPKRFLPDNLEGVVILLVVDTHDKHGSVSAGCRDDDSLGTTLQVSLRDGVEIIQFLFCTSHMAYNLILHSNLTWFSTYGGLLNCCKHTSGLHHILCTSLTPFNIGGVPPEEKKIVTRKKKKK